MLDNVNKLLHDAAEYARVPIVDDKPPVTVWLRCRGCGEQERVESASVAAVQATDSCCGRRRQIVDVRRRTMPVYERVVVSPGMDVQR